MIEPWAVLERRRQSLFGWLHIESKRVRSPRTGKEMEVKAFHCSPWTMVLPITPEKEVVMVRQYRHGTEEITLELPGGLVDPQDGSPEIAAGRELLEETGYRSAAVVKLGECFPQPAMMANKCFFFLAENAVKIQAPTPDDGEDIQIVTIPLADISGKIFRGEINHGMVLLAFSFFWMKQKKEKNEHPAETYSLPPPNTA